MSRFAPREGWKEFVCKWKAGERDKEILMGFRATEMAVRALLAQHDKSPMTIIDAAHIADYIRGQQEMIDQVLEHKQPKRARLLNGKRQKLRIMFLALVQQNGLPVEILKERCRTGSGPATLE